METKLIMIDVDDTLLDWQLSSKEAARLALEKRGYQMNDTFFATFNQINDQLWLDLEKRILTREQLFQIRWQKVFDYLDMPLDGPLFEKDFLKNLKYAAIKIPYCLEIMAYLHSKYAIAITSNGPRDQQLERLKIAKLDQYVDYYFISEDIGHPKPAQAFFDVCFSNLEYKKEETYLIGDSLSADIEGGKNYGLKTIYFNRKNQKTDKIANYTIFSLKEIEEIL